MPFKVVQTFEGKKLTLTTVPSGWENNNVLRYPSKYMAKHARDEFSTPMPDWEVIKCKVKRKNILSYETAESLVSEMTKRSDTEDEVRSVTATQRQRLQNKATLNLNSAAQNIMIQNNDTNSVPFSASTPTVLNYEVSYIEDTQPNPTLASQDLLSNSAIPLAQDSVNIETDKILQNQTDILSNQATISSQIAQNLQQLLDTNSAVSQIVQNQQQLLDTNAAIISQLQTLKNMQTNLIQKVCTLSVQLEDAVGQILSHPQERQDVQSLQNIKGHIDNMTIYRKPIDSAEELDQLEKDLDDPKTRDLLKNTYSILCSGGKGLDCAYMLVDVMFSRKFICECSWSGGCRGDGRKVPLKSYKRVLSFFWNMIHFWDSTFSLKDNELFFKTVLKNAKKRKIAKLERSSTSRRPKSSNKAKRMKLTEGNANNECHNENDDSENELNEEENLFENEEKNSLVQEIMEKRKEKNDSVNNKKIIIEDEERDDSAESDQSNDAQEINIKENMEEVIERNDSQEINPKENMEEVKERNDSQEINLKENMEEVKERDESQEINVKENIEEVKESTDLQKVNQKGNKKKDNKFRKETCV